MPREPPAPSPAPALAPVVSKSILSASTVSLEEFNEMVDHSNLTIRNEEADLHDESLVQQEAVMEMHHVQEPMDIKVRKLLKGVEIFSVLRTHVLRLLFFDNEDRICYL